MVCSRCAAVRSRSRKAGEGLQQQCYSTLYAVIDLEELRELFKTSNSVGLRVIIELW